MDVTSYLLGKGQGGGEVNLQDKTITPTTQQQVVSADSGYDGLHEVTINGVTSAIDQNITASNIKKDVSILGVTGSYEADVSDYFIMNPTSSQNKLFKIIKKIPQIDTSNITNFEFFFAELSSISTIPQIDTSNATQTNLMFNKCSNLTEVPLLNTSNVTNMAQMFSNCSKLVTIPQLNTSNVTNFNQVFANCSKLETIPLFDTAKVQLMMNCFLNCPLLTDTSLDNILQMCINARNFGQTKKLSTLGITDATAYPSSRIEALPHYQDFIDAGWTIS